MMDDIRFAQRVWDALEQAQKLPDSERHKFLDAVSADDPRLRAQLYAAFDDSAITTGSVDGALRGEAPDPPGVSYAGETVGDKYELIEEIGRGAMGTVYRARHLQLDQQFAVKVMPRGNDPDEILREGRRLADVDHDAIVQVVDVGSFDGAPYLVMEWLEGFDLAAWLRACDGAPGEGAIEDRLRQFVSEHGACDTDLGPHFTSYWRFVATLVRDVARAIARAHELGIAHQDISPKNILIAGDGSPTLVDFGLAVAFLDGVENGQYSPRGGTAPYMAPEHRSARTDASLVSNDVYGLGATLLHLATGVRPDRLSLTRMGVRTSRRFVGRHDRGSEVPRDLLLIGQKATHVDPVQRFGSASEFADELDRFLAFKPLSFAAPGLVRTIQLWWKRSPPRAGLTLLAPAFLVVVALIGRSTLMDLDVARAAASRDQVLQSFSMLPPLYAIPGRMDVPADLSPQIHDETVRLLDQMLEIEPELHSLRWRRVLAEARRGEVAKAARDLAVLGQAHPNSALLEALSPLLTDEDPEVRNALAHPDALPEPVSGFDHGILASLFHLARATLPEDDRRFSWSLLDHASKALQLDPGDFVTRELLVVKATISNPRLPTLDEHRAILGGQLGGKTTAGMLHATSVRAPGALRRQLIQRSLALSPYQYNARHNRANEAVLEGKGGDVLDELYDLLDERPYSAGAMRLILEVHRSEGSLEEAEELLRSLRSRWKQHDGLNKTIASITASHRAQVLLSHLADDSELDLGPVEWPSSPDVDGPGIRACHVLSLLKAKRIEREAAVAELTVLHYAALGFHESSEPAFTGEALLRGLVHRHPPGDEPYVLSAAEAALAHECVRCIEGQYDVCVRCEPLIRRLPARPQTTISPR